MKLRHYPSFNGAPMAQMFCAVINGTPIGKINGALSAPLLISQRRPNGAMAAQTVPSRIPPALKKGQYP